MIVQRDIWFYLAIFIQLANTLINIFAARIISQGFTDKNSIFHVSLVIIISIVISYFMESLINYIYFKNEIRLRVILRNSDKEKSSLVNNDIPLAVEAINFQILAPGIILSLIIYYIFLFRINVTLVLSISGLSLALLYPILFYVRWRRLRIANIRQLRNSLLDNFSCQIDEYLDIIDKYKLSWFHFWYWDVIIGIIFILTFMICNILLFYLIDFENIFYFLIVYFLLLMRLRAFLLSLTVYQENLQSMKRIEHNLKEKHFDEQM